MNEIEKLYTVDDIAQMTMLTSRTIRNYLKDGTLTGRKIGGQWRFTAKDIESLFHNSNVEEEIKNNRRQDIMDFMDGTNTDMDGEIQLCTIADYYCPDRITTKELSLQFSKIISTQSVSTKLKFNYEYIDKEQKARYTFFGTPSYIMAAVDVLDTEWNKLNESQNKFTDKADSYEKYRPSFPIQLAAFIHNTLGKKDNVIADIGSGTGRMTELLLSGNNSVYAIEPNADMRKIAETKFKGRKNFYSISSTADNTTLKADSIDAIVCAEAYHWFDNEKTILEFKRILKSQGFIFLTWDTPENNPYDGALYELLQRYGNQEGKEITTVSKEERAVHLFGKDNFQKIEFKHAILEPYEGLLGGSLSSAFAPKNGDKNYEAYVNGIKDIFSQYNRDGLIESNFVAKCYYGRI
jgi:excisionase family DNA binding protein